MYSKRHTLIRDRKDPNAGSGQMEESSFPHPVDDANISQEEAILNAVRTDESISDEESIRKLIRKMILEEHEAILRENLQDISASPEPQSMTTNNIIKPNRVTNKKFDATVKCIFPGAIDNYALVKHVASILMEQKGYNKPNTLLATSLCCDEASRQLEDDFQEAYGRNFNLGGLAGFPWAGQTGFAAMAHHIPEDGHCVLVYGPHVGITHDAVIGKVERAGIAHPDTCCGSAVAASNWVEEITSGEALITTNLQQFTDFQQGAVQQMMLPHCRRLDDAGDDRMKELPYAMYDSQDLLMRKITEAGAGSTRNGLILLGGVQINTGPTTPDYFHPLRFCFMNRDGDIVENMIPALYSRVGVTLDADGNVPRCRPSIRAPVRPSTVQTDAEISKKQQISFMNSGDACAHEPSGTHRQTKSVWGGGQIQVPEEVIEAGNSDDDSVDGVDP